MLTRPASAHSTRPPALWVLVVVLGSQGEELRHGRGGDDQQFHRLWELPTRAAHKILPFPASGARPGEEWI